MFAGSKSEKISKENNIILDFVKGILVAILISMALIVLFAFCLKWFSLSDSVIMPVILVIKAISVLFGSIIAVRGESKGLLKGLVFGAIYIVVAFVLFGLLAGSFSFDISSLLDIIFSILVGGIVGIIKVNRKS